MKSHNFPVPLGEDADSWGTMMFLYRSAIKEVMTKLDILKDEFEQRHRYNPIEHTKSRLKTAESIVKKLKKHGYESTIENMYNHINDIAGVRITCSFTSDIYRIAEMIANQTGIKVIALKDYLKEPKPSGYKSYHMLITVPIYLSEGSVVDTRVEIQIRTIAQDFWASLEHKIYYKFEGNAPDHISKELRECSEIITALDQKMLTLNNEIQNYAAGNNSTANSISSINSKTSKINNKTSTIKNNPRPTNTNRKESFG